MKNVFEIENAYRVGCHENVARIEIAMQRLTSLAGREINRRIGRQTMQSIWAWPRGHFAGGAGGAYGREFFHTRTSTLAPFVSIGMLRKKAMQGRGCPGESSDVFKDWLSTPPFYVFQRNHEVTVRERLGEAWQCLRDVSPSPCQPLRNRFGLLSGGPTIQVYQLEEDGLTVVSCQAIHVLANSVEAERGQVPLEAGCTKQPRLLSRIYRSPLRQFGLKSLPCWRPKERGAGHHATESLSQPTPMP